MYLPTGAHIAAARMRGLVLAATGDGAAATACLEEAAAGAAAGGPSTPSLGLFSPGTLTPVPWTLEP